MKPETSLRVLIADENVERAQTLSSALVASGYLIAGIADGEISLPELVARCEPDLVLINTDSPSRDTLEQLTTINRNRPRPVVMFANDEKRDTIKAAVRAGVSAYITNGMSSTRVDPVIEVAIAHFNEHQTIREELQRTKETLAERKSIDRAKGIIMKRRGCGETEAFALLRKAAMDKKKRIGQIAEEILHMADLLEANDPAAKGVKP